MAVHWHSSIDNILLYGFSAILVINILRLIAAGMAKTDGFGTLGRGLGALVS